MSVSYEPPEKDENESFIFIEVEGLSNGEKVNEYDEVKVTFYDNEGDVFCTEHNYFDSNFTEYETITIKSYKKNLFKRAEKVKIYVTHTT